MGARSLGVTTVAATLPVAFVVHDLEEVLTASWWSRNGPQMLRDRTPLSERRIRLITSTSSTQMALATSVVGLGVAAVSWAAARGHERPVRAAAAVFTAHGVGHAVSSALVRGYTPGVATAVTVVLPWGAWALRTLGRADGTPAGRALGDRALTGAGALALAVAGHAVGRRVL